jgi:hypothetical protein
MGHLQHVRTRMQHVHHDFQHKKRNDYIMNTNDYNMSRILLQHRYTTTATLKKLQKQEEVGPSRPAWGSGGRPTSSDALHLNAALAMGERRPAAGELRSPRRHPGVRPPGEVRPPSSWDAAARREAPPCQPGQQLRRLSWKEQHPRTLAVEEQRSHAASTYDSVRSVQSSAREPPPHHRRGQSSPPR